MHEKLKALKRLILGTMLTYLLKRNLLVANEFIKSKLDLMDLLNVTKHILWTKDILKNMALITKKHLLK